ncbi:MAG: hypothetical protein H6832_19010 [Planctomycetes bacterium]|nr:hypothetical protein [Planctomycetota bacterium]
MATDHAWNDGRASEARRGDRGTRARVFTAKAASDDLAESVTAIHE